MGTAAAAPSRDACWLNVLEGKVFEVAVIHRVGRGARRRPRGGWPGGLRAARALAGAGVVHATAHAAPTGAHLVVGAGAHELDVQGGHFEARTDLTLLVCPGAGFEAAFDVDA